MTNTGRHTTEIGSVSFEWGRRTYVMGVVNMTPDSFSGDGLGGNVDSALRQALSFQDEGADIVDVGGESTRPPDVYADASAASEQEEMDRVIPTIEALAQELDIPISIDTYKATVAREGLRAGASLINDVSGFRRDPAMAGVAAETGVPVVLMHNQTDYEYDDLVPDIVEALRAMRDSAIAAGVAPESVILDPGMGFGKNPGQNLEVLRRLGEFAVLGCPLLVGMSRKSTIGRVLNLPADDRVEGTAATVALSIAGGADIVRVHDVKQMVRVARMSDAIVRGWEPR